ncbi:MAG TPA: class D sortase [Myxococcaceae bacterium]|nr:class D sortase [Myxococcaceae bacterium]
MDRRGIWRRRLHLLERVSWAIALVLGGTWATARGLAWASERRSIAAFHETTRAAVPSRPTGARAPAVEVDQSLWDPGRIRAYLRALARPAPPPLALLRIPRLALEVPVLEGTDEWTLDRAVGHIEGTPRPDEAGNVGIAGHRDGFFRVLKDISEGDLVELALPAEVRRFRVARLSIVAPDEAQVLASTGGARLTLVTCYPFYFVGSAPRRFIVQAIPE